MENGYNIGALLALAFGGSPGIAFNVPKPPSLNDVQAFVGVNQYKPELKQENITETKKSWMGTPIMFPMKLKGGNNIRVYNDKGEVERVRYADFEMPAVTLCDFSRGKIMPETNVSSGFGSVKELFAFTDWEIRIRGLCLDEPGQRTAQQQKEGLLAFEKICDSIEVSGTLFEEKNIFRIAIGPITFRQIEGKPWVLPFEFTAKSDQPIELFI